MIQVFSQLIAVRPYENRMGPITHYGDLKYMRGMEIARFYAYSRYVSETARDRDHTDHI